MEADFEAEDVLSMYHLVSWSKENGGAGITAGFGQWENVKSIFPLHNEAVNRALLGHLSKRLFLATEDLDRIRDLFGTKVAFYFAYMQTYLRFLSFSAATGVLAWAFLPKYSFVYAVATLFGSTVFLEAWKIRQAELGTRWDVRGVGTLKVNQPKFRHEKIVVDAAGRTKHYFPKWKQVSRQLLQVPFFAAALLALGAIITFVFAAEVVIGEAYEGPHKWCLEYLPTLLLAAALPYINSCLEGAAAALVEYENHRTFDYYDMSLTQKLFGLSFIANYLPILLTAFVYIPLGDVIVPRLQACLNTVFGEGLSRYLDNASFRKDSDRLRNELIALTITGQLSDALQESVVPYVMHRVKGWYSTYRSYRSLLPHSSSSSSRAPHNHLGNEEEKQQEEAKAEAFLRNVQQQASLPPYNVQDDISEMAIQFGYLTLFSPVWPLVSVGFFVNNWIELRSDFFKICIDQQRPHPVRTDGIGPWVGWLDTLAWLGSLCTTAIVHVFGTSTITSTEISDSSVVGGYESSSWWWWSLPVSIWLGEHIFLAWRSAVQFVLQSLGSDEVRNERVERYARRKKYMERVTRDRETATGVPNKETNVHDDDNNNTNDRPEIERRICTSDKSSVNLKGMGQTGMDRCEEVGVRLIKTLKQD